MASNKVYAISSPKQLLGTDRSLAALISMANVLVMLTSQSWKIVLCSIAVSAIVIRFAQLRSIRDPWWFQLYKPYNRYADIYVPWHTGKVSERFVRPYGFGRDVKL